MELKPRERSSEGLSERANLRQDYSSLDTHRGIQNHQTGNIKTRGRAPGEEKAQPRARLRRRKLIYDRSADESPAAEANSARIIQALTRTHIYRIITRATSSQ
jgi:hypothetical protein